MGIQGIMRHSGSRVKRDRKFAKKGKVLETELKQKKNIFRLFRQDSNSLKTYHGL